MEIRNTLSVSAPPQSVFEALVDLERIGPCIPGATIGPAREDGAYPAEIAVRLGPMRMTYKGLVRIVEQDAPARRAVLSADVKESRGQGSASATMRMQLGEDGGGTSVESLTEVQMTGRAAQMGRGIIEDVAGRLVEEMAGNLSALLGEPIAQPAGGAATTDETPAPAGTIDGAPPTARSAQAGPPAPGRAPAKPVNGIGLLLKVLAARVARLLRVLAGRIAGLFQRTR
ncbi:MAG: SRPBCC family protein [Solirubrobacteraceae bacterium]|nr:SRPBCC family protein [Solirubrobacteraceae bacterium]